MNVSPEVARGTIRLSLGWVFLWAFLDKLFGFGHETTSKQAWIHGGSPTLGFLKMGAKVKGAHDPRAAAALSRTGREDATKRNMTR